MSDGQDADFTVQRAKGYSTLSDMMRHNSPRSQVSNVDEHHYTPKERYNMDSKEEEMGERSGGISRKGSFKGSNSELNKLPPAGLPSRLDQRPAGRSRSRRNSINAEESQLTIENFGGSQDNLNWISRNPDKEPYSHTGKRDSVVDHRRRSSSQTRDISCERRDLHRPSFDELDNRVVDRLEKDALEREKRDYNIKYGSRETLSKEFRRKSNSNREHHHLLDSSSGSEASYDTDHKQQLGKATSFAELSKLKEQLPSGINIIYLPSEADEGSIKGHKVPMKSNEKKTTFAALPNQTTWKQQQHQSAAEDHSDINGKSLGKLSIPDMQENEETIL